MYNLKKTVMALALAFPAVAFAQSAQDLKAELDALKEKVKQLEALITKVGTRAEAVEKQAEMRVAADEDSRMEFNRIRIKTEALEDHVEANGYKGLTISGYMDPAYIVNQRQRTSSFVFMKDFGDPNSHGGPGSDAPYSYDNAFFGSALIRFAKETENGTQWLLELMPHKGNGAGGGYNVGSIVNQAYVSLPMGSQQSRFLAGQIGSWQGYEYGLGDMKKTITNNLLFDFTGPTFVTGVGVDHIDGKWQSKAIVGNLNDGRISDRRSPALHWRVDYAKGEFQGFGFSGTHGKTSADTSINYVEVDGYFVRGDVTAQGQIETGRFNNGSFTGEDARWIGASALAAYKFTPRFEGLLRGDYIRNSRNGGGTPNLVFPETGCLLADLETDPTGETTMDSACGDYRNGFGPGIDNATGLIADPTKGANRAALTFGLNYAMTQDAILKLELRRDWADQNVFFDVRSGTFKKNNMLFGVSTLVRF